MKICKKKKLEHDINMDLYMLGLWNCEDTLYFNANRASASSISNTGNIEIPVNSIDNICKNEKVTFIKMDIEGSELMALKGAEKTIKTYKPKLAISLYHKPEDIIEIPLYVNSIVPEYKLYLRHYTRVSTETVLYAVI